MLQPTSFNQDQLNFGDVRQGGECVGDDPFWTPGGELILTLASPWHGTPIHVTELLNDGRYADV